MLGKLKSFILQSKRVWHVLRKPTGHEFKSIAKVAAVGVLILGAAGFIISDFLKILERFFG